MGRLFIIPTSTRVYLVRKAMAAVLNNEIEFLMWKNIANMLPGDKGIVTAKGKVIMMVEFHEEVMYFLSMEKFQDLQFWKDGEFNKARRQCSDRFLKTSIIRVNGRKNKRECNELLQIIYPEVNNCRLPIMINDNWLDSIETLLEAV